MKLSKFNPIILQKVFAIVGPDGSEIDQVQAANVSEALAAARAEHGKKARAAYLLPQRKEARFGR